MDQERILGRKAYANYRNIRALATLLAVLGALMFLGGVITAIAGPRPDDPDSIPRPVAIGLAISGVFGLVGGATTLGGNRKWARLSSVLCFLAIPIGPILAIVILVGLDSYLDSEERLQAAARRRRDREEGGRSSRENSRAE